MDPLPLPYEFPIPEYFHLNLRARFLNFFRNNTGDKIRNSILMLKGAYTISKHDDDQQYRVEQESNFFYLFGVDILDSYATIDIESGKSTVFVPRYTESYKMWNVVLSNDEIKQKFKLDDVFYVDEIENWLSNRNPSLIFYFYGTDDYSQLTPSLPDFPFLQNYNSNFDDLYWQLTECRVRKTDQEIEIMKHICKVSSDAHITVMQTIKKGNKEYQMEALFQYQNFLNYGCRFTAYECICGSGTNSSILHYEENDRTIEDGELILNDMGGKYYGYCSDITVTFPSNGRFTQKQAIIYNAVLDTQKQVHQQLKVGVNWGDMQLLAEKTITKHLFNAGLINGTMEELISNSICRLFFPHGLGHMLGLRTHDVGGYNKGCPPKLPELSQLQFRRNLDIGMVFTNEPGIYFIEFILQQAYQDPIKSKYLNKERIDEFMHVGGVRLEDDIVLTENGPVILNDVPRTIKQVEACIQGKDWKSINE